MTKAMPMIEARNKLTSLPEDFANEPELGAVAVTRKGKPVLAVMPWELYETIIETLEIMSDDEMTMAIRKSEKEIRAGKTVAWDKVKKELGL